MDKWFLNNLVCPRDHLKLSEVGNLLVCKNGHTYHVVDEIPIMLLDDLPQTMHVAEASIKRAKGILIDERAPQLYLESLGISEEGKNGIVHLSTHNKSTIDPVVSFLVAAAGGRTYEHLVGKLDSYPIPSLELPNSNGCTFLDIGCNWGRWCIAAEYRGYAAVGADPSLGAIMAAKRVSQQLGLSIKYVVADGRYLPFRNDAFDNVFSYSVLQHLERDNVKLVLSDISRILKPHGISLIQLPTVFGLLCLYHQAKRLFRKARNFEVRYWSVPSLRRLFSTYFGKSEITAEGYFGIGLQPSNFKLMPFKIKLVFVCSEILKRASRLIKPLVYIADSVYIKSLYSKPKRLNKST